VSSGTEALNFAQPGAMADASNVRHDTIVVPETISPAQVRALAQRKAQAQVGDDDTVAFCEVVPGLVEVEVAVPRSRPAVW
jgi:hypothetical protein